MAAPNKLTPAHKRFIDKRMSEGHRPPAIARMIGDKYGVAVSTEAVLRQAHKLGWSVAEGTYEWGKQL